MSDGGRENESVETPTTHAQNPYWTSTFFAIFMVLSWCRLRFQFYFLETSWRQAGFLCPAGQLCKIGRVPVNYLVLYFYPCLKST